MSLNFSDVLSDDIHIGTYFAFAIPAVHTPGVRGEFVVTPLADARVHIQAPAANLDIIELIAIGTSKRYDLAGYDMEVSVGLETKAIIITSDTDIKVEVIVTEYYDVPSSYLALPVRPHFTHFVTAAHFWPGTIDDVYTMVITVATEEDTTVSFFR